MCHQAELRRVRGFRPKAGTPPPPHVPLVSNCKFVGRRGRSPCPVSRAGLALKGAPGVETEPSSRSTWVGRGRRGPVFPFSPGPKGTHWPHLEPSVCQSPALEKAQGTVPGRLRSERPVPPGRERGRQAAPGVSPVREPRRWPSPDTALPQEGPALWPGAEPVTAASAHRGWALDMSPGHGPWLGSGEGRPLPGADRFSVCSTVQGGPSASPTGALAVVSCSVL